MKAKELEAYLRAKIPLTRAMRVRVVDLQADSVTVQAPLRPNWNHQHTAFGGSISAMALLAGWALVHARLEDACEPHVLVVQRQEVHYRKAVTGPLTAHATLLDESDWLPFLRSLRRHRKGSITAISSLEQDGKIAAQFRGEFVALAPQKARRTRRIT